MKSAAEILALLDAEGERLRAEHERNSKRMARRARMRAMALPEVDALMFRRNMIRLCGFDLCGTLAGNPLKNPNPAIVRAREGNDYWSTDGHPMDQPMHPVWAERGFVENG